MGQNKKYFVFISYSSKDNEDDNKWAEWLRHELDHWHLPAAYSGRKPVQDNLRQVFRDRDGFSAGKEWDKQVEPILKESQNLIVICSPNAAKSQAVNREVEIFVNQGKEDYIFPFIVEGDSPRDCFPAALKHSKVGGDVNKDGGRDAAFIKVVAGMLGIDFTDLYNRYELEKAEQEQKEREEKEKLLIAQSRFLAEKANQLVEEGDSYTARLLVLEALPKDKEYPDKPYVLEAEASLRMANLHNSAILRGHKDHVNYVHISPDGNFIVSASNDGSIRIWDVYSGKCMQVLEGHTDIVSMALFSPNGKYIVSASKDGCIRIWDAKTGECLQTLHGHKKGVSSISFSPNGKRLVSTSEDSTVKVWILSSGRCLHSYCGPVFSINSSSFGSDGKHIVSACYCGAFIWEVSKDGPRKRIDLEGHTDNVNTAFFSPNGKQVVTASKDKTIRIYNALTGKCKRILTGHSEEVTFASFSPDGKYVISTSRDKKIRIWNSTSGKCIHIYDGHADDVTSASFVLDKPIIVSASFDWCVRIWELADKQYLNIFQGHDDSVTYASFSPDGKRVVSTSCDKTIRVWDVLTSKCVLTIRGHKEIVNFAIFSPNGLRLISGSRDNTVCIWDAYTGACIRVIKYKFDWPQIAEYSSDHKRLMITSLSSIQVWDSNLKKRLQSIPKTDEFDMFNSASFSPDGKKIVTTMLDKPIQIWDTCTVTLIRSLSGHKDNVRYASFSPDGRQIASASDDKTARVWDVSTGKCIAILEGHTSPIDFLSFSANGKYIVSASEDSTIRIWNTLNGVCVHTLNGHTGGVLSALFSPDGKYLVSSSYDKTVRIWDFPNLQELIDKNCERFKERQLTPEERRKYYLE